MKKLLLTVVVLVVAAAAATPMRGYAESPERRPADAAGDAAMDTGDRRGALVDEIVFTQESDAGKIAALIEGGSHHIFAQGITSTTVFHRLRTSERTAHELSYGSVIELTLNPAGPEFTTGELNPFHVREVREALNWLVNRRHIAEEIFGGLAVPRVLPITTAFPDYARLAEEARALELRYPHAPDRATRVISEEMEALGARLDGGRWLYNGEPVRISVLIRTEDARREVGDYIANLLEDLGFQVERLYRSAQEASRIWIAGDPAAGRWHVYTGSWVTTIISRDQSDNLSFYYTPRGRPEALWQAYEPGPELDEIAERLQRRDYATWEERQEMMARGLELAMRNSVRIWLADQITIGPRASDVALAADLAGGIAGSRMWPYTVRFRGRLGGTVVFAAPSLMTEPWNPVAGSNWLYDTMINRALVDPPVLPDPFTGLYRPQRIAGAAVTVAEGVPVGRTLDWLTVDWADTIPVPEDTWVDWDGEAGRFRTVGEQYPDGVSARTRTVVRYEDGYLDRRWHDGTRVSLADVVLPWILAFERADEDSRLHDPSYVPGFEVFQRHFRGWRIVSRDPLVIEIYSDQVYPDAETIVAARTPSAEPWHTIALGIMAESNGELAFSSHKADRLEVNWMNMIAGPSLSILERLLDRAAAESYVPFHEAMRGFLRDGEPDARYAALRAWYAARGHFQIGAGPFYLHSVHPVERSLVARRFEDFPDRADKWLQFTSPPIPELDLDGPMLVPQDQAVKFGLRITFEDEPYPVVDLESVKYLLFDGDGRLARRGEAEPAGDGRWTIELPADEVAGLGAGANSLEVAVISRRVALPTFATHGFATVPAGTAALEAPQ
jgi:peptide/nickel transport system substrate-binding protein